MKTTNIRMGTPDPSKSDDGTGSEVEESEYEPDSEGEDLADVDKFQEK